jgi:ketosteroid isomerase-like protein
VILGHVIDRQIQWVFGENERLVSAGFWATVLNESGGALMRISEMNQSRHRVRVNPLVSTLAVLLVLVAPAAKSRAQGATDEVERTVTAFLQVFANRNVQGFIDYFVEDATFFMPPSATGASPIRVEGRTSIAREFEGLYQRLGLQGQTAGRTINPQNLLVQRYGDVAVVTFHLGTETARGRRTLVMLRTAAWWKIAHVHASDFPAR